MKASTQKETEAYLRDFTNREDALMELVKVKGLVLPERLNDWRFWIGDSQIYLNELRNFVETTPVR
jgi:hypothetical protein